MTHDVVVCLNVRPLLRFDELKPDDMYHFHSPGSKGPNVIVIGPKQGRNGRHCLIWVDRDQRFELSSFTRNTWAGEKAYRQERLHMI